MARLIDADALERDIRKYAYCLYEADDAIAFVREAPTVEADPIYHAHWIEHPWSPTGWKYTCSKCCAGMDSKRKRCPDCGAYMDEEVRG